MGTGNKPMYDEDDYDIDCGLLFEINKAYYPVEVKKWVFDALNIEFRRVEWKKAHQPIILTQDFKIQGVVIATVPK